MRFLIDSAGAEEQCAPAALIRPLAERPVSLALLVCGPRFRAAPRLHRKGAPLASAP